MGFWDIVLEAKKSSSKQPNKEDLPEEEVPEEETEDTPPEEENPDENPQDEGGEETPEDGEGLEISAEPASDEGGEDTGVDDFSADVSTGDDPETSSDEGGTDNFDGEVMGGEEENPEGETMPEGEGGEGDPALAPEDGAEGGDPSEVPPEGENGDLAPDNNLEDEQKDNDTVTREYNLLCDFEELYELVLNCLGILEKVKTKDMIMAHIATKCKKNFEDILDRIDRYIHFNYKTKSYVENLTIYNYLVQSTKITIEMLKNVKNLANI